jgi:hypothetical protein
MSILTASVPIVNFDFPSPDPDEYRPTAGPDFTPTPEELEEAAWLLNSDEPDWDTLAKDDLALDVVSSGHSWM